MENVRFAHVELSWDFFVGNFSTWPLCWVIVRGCFELPFDHADIGDWKEIK